MEGRKTTRWWVIVVGVTLIAGSALAHRFNTSVSAQTLMVPRFEIDPYWPKPLPNNAVLGWILGFSADARDNIWVIQRPDTVPGRFTAAKTDTTKLSENEIRLAVPRDAKDRGKLVADWVASAVKANGRCCSPFPDTVLQFDQKGNLLKHFLPFRGGTKDGFEMLDFPHGITVDHKGNLWIGNNTPEDSRILKFDQNGKFLLQIGTKGVTGDSNDTKNMNAPGNVTIDPVTNEAYVSDGSFNRRVIVFDGDTGQYKRHWGAYGKRPDDKAPNKLDPNGPPPQQFNGVHCAMISNDRFVYVCDWHNNRLQVFRTDGTYIKEGFVDKASGGSTTYAAIFSTDRQQKFIYVLDGQGRKIHILLRDTLETVSSFGASGSNAGEFMGNLHSMDTDAQGNLYVSDADQQIAKVHKFVYKGLVPVAKDQGVPWPLDRK